MVSAKKSKTRFFSKQHCLKQFYANVTSRKIPCFHFPLNFKKPNFGTNWSFCFFFPKKTPKMFCQNMFIQLSAFMLLQPHAKNQKSSMLWFLKNLKTSFGAYFWVPFSPKTSKQIFSQKIILFNSSLYAAATLYKKSEKFNALKKSSFWVSVGPKTSKICIYFKF